jgi:hypothetical protein
LLEAGVTVAPVSQDIRQHLASIQAGGEGLKVFSSVSQQAAEDGSGAGRSVSYVDACSTRALQPPPTLARTFISKVRGAS